MAKNDPIKRRKELTLQVFNACKEAGMEVEHNQELFTVTGKDFHIKVKDVPLAKNE